MERPLVSRIDIQKLSPNDLIKLLMSATSADATIEEGDLELDSINQNPCMTTLLQLIDHMHAKIDPQTPTTASSGRGTLLCNSVLIA